MCRDRKAGPVVLSPEDVDILINFARATRAIAISGPKVVPSAERGFQGKAPA
jgi:Holliday junction resolvase